MSAWKRQLVLVSLFMPINGTHHRHPSDPEAFSATDCQIPGSRKNLSPCSENGRHMWLHLALWRLPWRSSLLTTLISNLHSSADPAINNNLPAPAYPPCAPASNPCRSKWPGLVQSGSWPPRLLLTSEQKSVLQSGFSSQVWEEEEWSVSQTSTAILQRRLHWVRWDPRGEKLTMSEKSGWAKLSEWGTWTKTLFCKPVNNASTRNTAIYHGECPGELLGAALVPASDTNHSRSRAHIVRQALG